ncbi:MAG TPA: Gfo/Idh/MocA family oxidoreductase [Thermoanaerobaculia bacterium]|nr:Gfo/Idh/MocA family oxidoreductase [Thermoanaerobaculia bacterium]
MTRVGVIGTGYLGRRHARVLTEIPEANVAGFVEPKDENAAEVQQKHSLRRFDSVAAIAKEIDCAVIATPTTTHFEIAQQLLIAGCDVMIEKPITTTPEQARWLIDLAAKHGRIIQVGHVERYNPAITAIADEVRNTRFFVSERISEFSNRSVDIDVLFDLLIHDLNLVLSLIGGTATDIRALGVPVVTEKVDIANVRLELDNGAVANLTASRVSQKPVREQRFFGTDFYYSVDTKAKQVKGYRMLRGGKIEPAAVIVEDKEPLRAELESFLQCVRDRSRPIVAGEDGLAAVELAKLVGEKIDESLRRIRG